MVEPVGQSQGSQQTPQVEAGHSTETQTVKSVMDLPRIDQPQAQPKFAEKSPEEVAEAYRKLESEHGRQAKEVGDLRNENAQFRQWFQQIQAQQQAQMQQRQVQQPVEDDTEEDSKFLQSPSKMTKKAVQEETAKMYARLKYEESFSQAQFAKEQAKLQNPDLFRGLNEQELDQVMYGGVQSGLIRPDVLRQPKGWEMAAWQLKGRDAGFKMTTPPTQSTAPVTTEVPSSVRPQNAPSSQVQYPDEWEEMWDKMGFTKEQKESAYQRSMKIRDGRR